MVTTYRKKLLFVLIVAIATFVSVMIVISWMSHNQDIESLRNAYGFKHAYGYIDPQRYTSDPDLVNNITQVNYWETLVNYCFDHADRPNPLQDLRDKGFSVIGSDCKQVKLLYDEQLNSVNKIIANYSPNFCDLVDPIERQNYPNCRGK